MCGILLCSLARQCVRHLGPRLSCIHTFRQQICEITRTMCTHTEPPPSPFKMHTHEMCAIGIGDVVCLAVCYIRIVRSSGRIAGNRNRFHQFIPKSRHCQYRQRGLEWAVPSILQILNRHVHERIRAKGKMLPCCWQTRGIHYTYIVHGIFRDSPGGVMEVNIVNISIQFAFALGERLRMS